MRKIFLCCICIIVSMVMLGCTSPQKKEIEVLPDDVVAEQYPD